MPGLVALVLMLSPVPADAVPAGPVVEPATDTFTAAAVFAPLAPPGTADPAPEVMQAALDADSRMTVPVSLEGNGPFRFLVDTGSQSTVLSRDVVERLRLAPHQSARIVGIAGIEEVPTARFSEIRLGEAGQVQRALDGMAVPVLDARHIGADGILGIDSLKERRVLIDFTRNQVEILPTGPRGPSRGYEIVVRAKRKAGQLILTSADIDGVRTAVMIDTGGHTSLGNRALQRALDRKAADGSPRPTSVTLRSVTGQTIAADLGLARRMDLDTIHLENIVIAFVDNPAFSALGLANRPALFLGMRELRLFDRIAIDFDARKVLFDLPGR